MLRMGVSINGDNLYKLLFADSKLIIAQDYDDSKYRWGNWLRNMIHEV